MTLEIALIVAVSLFTGSALQAAIGFGYGLLAIPLLVWCGVPLSHTVTLVVISTLVQSLVMVCELRDHIDWKEVFPAALIRYVTIPIGIWLLTILEGLDKSDIKQILGTCVLLALAIRVFWKTEPRDHLHPIWRILAFSCSGIMGAMVGMAGPPIMLWVMSHNWSNQKTRGFIFAVYALSAPVIAGMMVYTFGMEIVMVLLMGLAFTPIVAIGASCGNRLGNLISKELLRRIAYIGLTLIGAVSIIGVRLPQH